jgi:hypothetical protein
LTAIDGAVFTKRHGDHPDQLNDWSVPSRSPDKSTYQCLKYTWLPRSAGNIAIDWGTAAQATWTWIQPSALRTTACRHAAATPLLMSATRSARSRSLAAVSASMRAG